MIEEDHLEKLRLSRRPAGQLVMARLLGVNYRLPPANRIEIEGVENIPRDRPVFFALNHTDRFNYWPFQWRLWTLGDQRFTTSWVKAKYYENQVVSFFLSQCNNIPLPSLGYVILNDAVSVLGRRLSDGEYRLFRDLVDQRGDNEPLEERLNGEGSLELLELLRLKRRDYSPDKESYAVFIRRWTARLMKLVEARTLEALFERENNVIVFPQGTRSLRLLPARTGMLEFALRHKLDIVPVGSNGCERLYPGGSPVAKPGAVVYRVGKPLTIGEHFSDCRIEAPYTPFTDEADPYEEIFFRAAGRVTAAIDALLDAPYRLEESGEVGASEVGSLI